MILAAHQSHYLPWLGYFDKIDRSDIFVVLDDVQYEKNGWQNRNRIRTPQGTQWLTVPVHAHISSKISEVTIARTTAWEKTHAKSLELNYKKSPHFSLLWSQLESVYANEWSTLIALNETLLQVLLKAFGIMDKKIVLSSSLDLQEQASQRLVALCRYFKADTYLSGEGAKAYLDLPFFEKEGIKVQFQNFSHPIYSQRTDRNTKFIEGLSAVDLLFQEGKQSLGILRGEET